MRDHYRLQKMGVQRRMQSAPDIGRHPGREGEHSVILTLPVIAVDSAQTPERVYRYIWHIAALTCDGCSPQTTRHQSA